MSLRKSRVHQTGSSNADYKNLSLSPIKTRPLLHEPKSSIYGLGQEAPDPRQATMQSYKTWDKQMKTVQPTSPGEEKLSLKVDPPDFAFNGKRKNWIREEGLAGLGGNLREEFRDFVLTNSVNLKAAALKRLRAGKDGINCQEFRSMLESLGFSEKFVSRAQEVVKAIGREGVVRMEDIGAFCKERFEVSWRKVQEKDDGGFLFNEKDKAPVSKLELIFAKGNRIRLALQSKFKTAANLLSDLQSKAPNNRILLSELKACLARSLENPNQSDLDSLLSSYSYNTLNQTSLSEAVNFIFMDNHSAQDYLHIKKRAIAPKSFTSHNSASSSPLPPSSPAPQQIRPILLRIEEKMLTQGPNRFLPVFKSFDKDNDGYLTLDDLSRGLKSNQIVHSEEDAERLFRFLDENSNGFVTFQEFCRKIQPNIITVNRKQLKEEEFAHINLAQPSRVFYETQRNRLPPLIEKGKNDLALLKVATRYGSTPAYQDTFPAFAPGKESPMFLDDGARYWTKRFEPANLANEDKEKVRRSLDAKLNVLKKVRDDRNESVKEAELKILRTDEKNVILKQSMKMEYERKCKEMPSG